MDDGERPVRIALMQQDMLDYSSQLEYRICTKCWPYKHVVYCQDYGRWSWAWYIIATNLCWQASRHRCVVHRITVRLCCELCDNAKSSDRSGFSHLLQDWYGAHYANTEVYWSISRQNSSLCRVEYENEVSNVISSRDGSAPRSWTTNHMCIRTSIYYLV